MSDPANDLKLSVNGSLYGGWTSIRVKRSLEEMASSFQLSYTDRWYPDAQPLPINEGDQCSIQIDGNVVLSGYVDDSTGFYDTEQHTLDVTGRSAAGDLCDCSAIFKTGHWKQALLTEIAQNLCQPFGLQVTAQVNIGAAMDFGLEPGESVYSTLDRAAKLRGVLVTSDASGNVLLTRAGLLGTRTALEYGVNIKSGHQKGSWKDRFSSYTLTGQSTGSDNWSGKSAAHISATMADQDVTRYRPLLVNLAEQGTVGLQAHVQWEANVRAGRSRRYTYRVVNWYCAEGLWTPNTMVHVTDPYWGLDDDLLIISAEFSRDSEGTVTDLEVGPRESFDLIAFPKRKQHRKAKRNEAKTT